ncbi:unnamed protein product [Trichobilharzia szidati]|nr:unnamed protein product [Trichobilharzia szidati]
MCSFSRSEIIPLYHHNKIYMNKVFLIFTIIGILCLISGTSILLLWIFIPEYIPELSQVSVKISAIICTIGVVIVTVIIIYLYCQQYCLIRRNNKKRRKKLSIYKNGVHYSDGELYSENESFATNYKLSAPSSLSMPEVFTTNGNLMHKAFVSSLGSLELEKFEVVGVVHKTSSNLDFISVENNGGGRHKSVTDDTETCSHSYRRYRSTGSHPNILIVDQLPNIFSGKTFYFHSTNDTDGNNNNNNNKDYVHATTTTTTTITTTPAVTTTPTTNTACVNTVSSDPKKLCTSVKSIPYYLLPRVSIQEINEINLNFPATSYRHRHRHPYPHQPQYMSVRRTRSDRIKRGKISRSILIPTDYSLDSHILLSRSENTQQLIDNKPSISSIGCMITDRRSSSSGGGGGCGGHGGAVGGVGYHNHSDNSNNNVKNNNRYHLLYTNGIVPGRSYHPHKPSTDSEISTMDNSISYLFGTTPPIGQASLFNLNTANTIFITQNNDNSSSNNNNNIDDEKGAELNTNTSAPTTTTTTTPTTTTTAADAAAALAPATSMNSEEKDPLKGKYFVIMKNCDDSQSPHKPQPVLSCTTLFTGDEDNSNNNNSNNNNIDGDNEIISINNNDNSNGVNSLKYLQGIYSTKWNVFPVYIENDRMIQSNSVDKKSFHNEDSDSGDGDGDEEKRTPSSIPTTPSASHHQRQHREGVKTTGYSIFNPVRSLIDKMKQRWTKRKTMKSKRSHHHHQKTRMKKRTTIKSISKETVQEFSEFSLTQDSNFNDILLDSYTANSNNNNTNTNNSNNNYEKHRRQTIITNASIFSLPAIPPALWNAERPVWIMGVPLNNPGTDEDMDNDSYSNNNISDHWFTVDTNKLILLKRQQLKLKNNNQNQDNLTDLQNLNITGSSSSIYAFHVRPPPRLKPATTSAAAMEKSINHHSHTRARSVGQMLTTCDDKSQT